MPAYFIVDDEVTDPAGFDQYRKQVPGTVEKYGGKLLVRGGHVQTLEGDWKPERILVTAFPSIENARRWCDSEEYRALKALRLRTARGSVVLVGGLPSYVRLISRYIVVAVVRCSRSRAPLNARVR